MKKGIAFIVLAACTFICLTKFSWNVKISRIKLPEYSEIETGKTLELKTEYYAEKATAENIIKAAEKLKLFWTSSDETVATVDNGIITGVSYGQAIITVSTEDNSLSAQTTIKVKSPVEYIEIEDISISEEDKDIDIEYKIFPVDIENIEIVVEILDESIATIVDGKISAVKAGKTELHLKVHDIEKIVKVIVQEKEKPVVAPIISTPKIENKVNNAPSPSTAVEVPKAEPAPAPVVTPRPIVPTPEPTPTPIPAPTNTPIPIYTPEPTPTPQNSYNIMDKNQNLGDTHNPGYSAADNPIIRE